jgi:hypothetical protein
LNDGRVLVTGGDCIKPDLSSAEIFDRATETWSLAACLNDGRRRHTTTLLADGRVLVTGGEGIVKAPMCEKIGTPVSGGRPKLLDTSTLNSAMNLSCLSEFGPGAGAHIDRRLILGLMTMGSNTEDNAYQNNLYLFHRDAFGFGTLDTAEIYDPITNTWTMMGRMTHPRENHTATLLPNGQVLLVGGWFEDAGSYKDSASVSHEIFDPDTNEFYSLGSLDEKYKLDAERCSHRCQKAVHSAILMPDGRVLVVGGIHKTAGGEALLIDPTSGEISQPFDSASYAIPIVLEDDYVLLIHEGYPAIYDVLGLLHPEGHQSGARYNQQTPTAFIQEDGSGLVLGSSGLSVWRFIYDPESVPQMMASYRFREIPVDLGHLEGGGPRNAQGFAAVDLGDNEILITGGSSPPNYDPASAYIVKFGSCWIDESNAMVGVRLVCADDLN